MYHIFIHTYLCMYMSTSTFLNVFIKVQSLINLSWEFIIICLLKYVWYRIAFKVFEMCGLLQVSPTNSHRIIYISWPHCIHIMMTIALGQLDMSSKWQLFMNRSIHVFNFLIWHSFVHIIEVITLTMSKNISSFLKRNSLGRISYQNMTTNGDCHNNTHPSYNQNNGCHLLTGRWGWSSSINGRSLLLWN